jgi:N-acetylmuramoyl-L-alanine amidase
LKHRAPSRPEARARREGTARPAALFRRPALLALFLCVAGAAATTEVPSRSTFDELLRDPTPAQWRALSQFDRTLTRREFESRLDKVFDPGHGLRPYLWLGDDRVAIYPTSKRNTDPVSIVRFAAGVSADRPPPVSFRSPTRFRRQAAGAPGPALSGLRVAIDPADIGGRWAKLEDRSVEFAGYGRISEGDLNLAVGRLLRDRLAQLGATVFLVRDRAEPVLTAKPDDLRGLAQEVLRERPWLMPESFQRLAGGSPPDSPRLLRAAEGLLLTKTLETRARAALVRRSFTPDVTVVLQHNATPESTGGGLTPVNRNTFFVHGAYTPAELREPEQRFRLLAKLLEGTAPIEAEVAAAIAVRFKAATAFAPVLSGNSANTRLVLPGNPYVVARNLAFNREHDGPVVVTEPYYMNQADTLTRLLAGDYAGERRVAGRLRVSIYREYADCVAAGLVDSYGAASGGRKPPG